MSGFFHDLNLDKKNSDVFFLYFFSWFRVILKLNLVAVKKSHANLRHFNENILSFFACHMTHIQPRSRKMP